MSRPLGIVADYFIGRHAHADFVVAVADADGDRGQSESSNRRCSGAVSADMSAPYSRCGLPSLAGDTRSIAMRCVIGRTRGATIAQTGIFV
jgi:hypothetical protein